MDAYREGEAARAAKIASAHLVVQNGIVGSGIHLLVDIYEISNRQMLTDANYIEGVLRAAAGEAKATVEACLLKPFPGGGVAGVLVLSESHISIHTWPEFGYAAIDIFMCGSTEPHKAVRYIGEACAGWLEYKEVLRGNILAKYL